jgi:hypothetical protein
MTLVVELATSIARHQLDKITRQHNQQEAKPTGRRKSRVNNSRKTCGTTDHAGNITTTTDLVYGSGDEDDAEPLVKLESIERTTSQDSYVSYY